MAINMILGQPGQCKTYTVVSKWILKLLKDHQRRIVTNIPLNIDHFKKEFPNLPIDDLIKIKRDEGSPQPFFSFKTAEDFQDDWVNDKGQKAMIIVDEAQFLLSSSRGRNVLRPINEFLSMHRHENYDIIFITQTTKGFDSTALGLVDHFYHCRKLSSVGQNKKYKLTLKNTGSKGDTGIIQQQVLDIDPKIFPFYKSHSKSDGDSDIEEAIDPNVKSLWRHPVFYGIAFIPFFFIFLWWKGWLNFNIFSATTKTSENAKNLERSQNSPVLSNQSTVSSQEVVQKNKRIQALNGEVEELKNQNKELAQALDKIQSHPFTSSNIIIKGSSWMPSNQSKFVFSALVEGPNGIFTTNSKSLKKIGYDIEYIDSCLYKWTFKEFNGYWTCGSAKDQKRLSENMKL